MNKNKYGLLNVLNDKLKHYNYIHQADPDKGYKEIQDLKAEINRIKNSTYEGLKIRARINDKMKGETISSYMIGKQKQNADKYMEYIKVDDCIVDDPKAIINHATNFFEKLYEEPNVDKKNENVLLSSLEKVITEEENDELMKTITEIEVHSILEKLKENKSPGEDGITSEFYIKFWSFIKNDY